MHIATLFTFVCFASLGQIRWVRQPQGVNALSVNFRQPTLYLFGDSTMARCRFIPNQPIYTTNTAGWGTPLISYLSLPIINDAIQGYSSRLAFQNNLYNDALKTVQIGDFVIIQWGRNDGKKVVIPRRDYSGDL